MSIGDYRYRLPGGMGPDVSTNGRVIFDVWVEVQVDDDPESWQVVDGGHFSLPIPGAALEQAQNAGQVLEYIEGEIKKRGLVQSDRARRALYSLLPNGVWPVNDVIRAITIG